MDPQTRRMGHGEERLRVHPAILNSLVPDSFVFTRVLTGHGADIKGWTAPEGEDEQVFTISLVGLTRRSLPTHASLCRQIFTGLVLTGRSLPPTYLPKNVFFFKKLD